MCLAKMNIKMMVRIKNYFCFVVVLFLIIFFIFSIETREVLLRFLIEGRREHPNYFNQGVSSDPEAAQFVNLL